MGTDNLAKLQRTSGFVSTISLIVMILATLILVVSAVLLILCLIDAQIIYDIVEAAEISKNDIEITLSLVFLSIIFVDTVMFFVYKIFKDIEVSYTPFKKENSKRLMQISYILMIYAIVIPILSAIIVGSMDLNDDLQIDFNPVFIAVAVLFYCMSLVFDYGAKLQQESDETL
jgi:hypothetical protein